MSDKNNNHIPTDTLAETENYIVWLAEEPDGETTYHLELGAVTVHFFREEWDEFITLVRQAAAEIDKADDENLDEDTAFDVELDWGSLYFSPDEWTEFIGLIDQVD
ncbi:MAG: hypothetical protein JXJ20_15000 [Anaerolineae bacterium]|jgi:hypothetical protein|nr:hypothetical protein [Anaerolineae bacterium]